MQSLYLHLLLRLRRPLVGATGVTSRFCTLRRKLGRRSLLVLADTVTVRGRRAGLSPSATSMRVLTATAVSMIAGKTHAVAELYPMACIRSRSARKLTANAPTPMAATAATAQR